MVEAMQSDLRNNQPNLHLHIHQNGRAEICGTYIVWSDEGKELDRYKIEIRLPGRYPKKLPIVREVGGRIPRIPDRHVTGDGTACVLMPEDRGRCFPEGAPFSKFLNGPLRDFFLSQAWFEQQGEWPFKQWKHGVEGIFEYYRELTGVMDTHAVIRYVRVLSYPRLKGHILCPCGSKSRLRDCCHEQVSRLRETVDPVFAKRSLKALNSIKGATRRLRKLRAREIKRKG